MEKTITIYDLLGLINDNQAPKRIKISELIYDFDDESQLYFDEESNELSDNIYLTQNLNHPVEILNEILEEEKEIPEKLNYKEEHMSSSNGFLLQYCVDFAIKIDEIIDYFEYLKRKGNE